MRDIPIELATRIESGAATLCHVWIATRADGARMGFSDHDRALTIDGVVCRAETGWTQGAAETATGLTAGSLAIGGALDAGGVNEAALVAGAWDGASVETWRVDWRRPDLRVRLGSGRLGRVRREGEGFTADLDGPLAALDRVVGRTYGRLCDAVLGDARCGVEPGGRTCDKRWETCVGEFGNGVNFRGFPEVPGDDFLTAYPATGGRHDGGSRR
ncbi:baseplate hub protein [Brevundimonas aurifodinae]|uniref:DUF2163 domain-containing protein n=2 Tax=Brevundimonas TaxID=41275 RepID=A0ABV1NLU0_9CAUL|nr:MAG: hypothetical protein B7Z42_04805 [Brevundimonas sp. 12-68-7]OYX36116.1 MAG: hypothetical protein B7Z01_00220 [Brevundimonas subvibrioides]